MMLEMLEAIGLDKRLFGLHSLRAGGASAAANAGVVDRLFKRHGRWKSENAKDGYVRDALQERLKVSRNLGLSDQHISSIATFFVASTAVDTQLQC